MGKDISNVGPGISPLGDRVLVRPLDESELGTKTASGIIIPETVDKEKTYHGKVVAVGPGKVGDDNEYIPVGVRVGQTVIYSRYSGDEIKMAGTEYLLLREENILAVLN